MFWTFNSKKCLYSSNYTLVGKCPSFSAVSLNREWASHFSLLHELTTSFRCLPKYDWCYIITSLYRSSKVGICMYLQYIFILRHFATACCMMLTLVYIKIASLPKYQKNSLFSLPVDRPLSLASLPLSLDKGVSTLLGYLCSTGQRPYWSFASLWPILC